MWSRLFSRFSGRNEDHLEQVIKEARDDGELKAEEGSMLLSILTLDELQVQDIMTPRTDIDCVASGTSVVEVARAITETGHSRLPVYNGTRDNIIGIAYAKDTLEYLVHPEGHDVSVDRIMRPPFFVPETKISSELLQEFRARKNHLAIVVDEYGGTSGLVTIEDLLEVIVGDIEDEHDAPREEDFRQIGEGVADIRLGVFRPEGGGQAGGGHHSGKQQGTNFAKQHGAYTPFWGLTGGGLLLILLYSKRRGLARVLDACGAPQVRFSSAARLPK